MAIMAGDALPYVPTNAPTSQQIAAINRIIDRLNDMLSQITLSDGSNRRMFIGYQQDGWGAGKNFGIKISIPGVDVLKATDSQLLFKMDIETWYWFDATTQKNIMQLGKLPDGTYGETVAKSGHNVSEIYG